MNKLSESTPPAAASKERSRLASSRSRSSLSMIVLISAFRGKSTPSVRYYFFERRTSVRYSASNHVILRTA
jgi:hypothetical protein